MGFGRRKGWFLLATPWDASRCEKFESSINIEWFYSNQIWWISHDCSDTERQLILVAWNHSPGLHRPIKCFGSLRWWFYLVWKFLFRFSKVECTKYWSSQGAVTITSKWSDEKTSFYLLVCVHYSYSFNSIKSQMKKKWRLSEVWTLWM